MRRKDREITDRSIMEKILEKSEICRVAMCDENMPYIVPMNFGYKDGCLFLHSAAEGRKIEILKKNQNVCFEVETECESVKAEISCEWSMKYQSVIGFGKAHFLEETEQKINGLDVIVEKYTGRPYTNYTEEVLKRLAVIRVDIESVTGKSSMG
jgi:nitroimidazol reductase NimA-like FMN-containing flavoprotein (pyridoxamine 5'-phosphate oxidase superfamily)